MTAPDFAALAARCREPPGEAMRLDDHDPADRMGLFETDAEAVLAAGAERLAVLHGRLFAQRAWSVLLVLLDVPPPLPERLAQMAEARKHLVG